MNAGDSARSTWHARRRHHGEGSVDMGFPVGWNRALVNYQHLFESWEGSNASAGSPAAQVRPKRSDFMIAIVDIFFCMSSWGEEFCTAAMSAMQQPWLIDVDSVSPVPPHLGILLHGIARLRMCSNAKRPIHKDQMLYGKLYGRCMDTAELLGA